MKTQLKKSLSLFLAVLMILSCWVWVAPTEADAAEITPLTQYTVKINVTFDNPCDGGHVTNNGTTVISSFPSSFKAEGAQTLTYTTTSFPTKIMIRFTTNSWSTSKGTVTSISVNDHTVISGGWGLDKTCVFSGANSDYTFERTSDTSSNQSGTVDWPLPKTAGFVDSTASGDEQTFAINKLGGAETYKSTTFRYGTFYDQYGVKYSSGKVSELTKSVWISKTPTGEDLGDSNIYYDASKGVVAKPELQLTQGHDNGKFVCYLIESYTGKNIEGGEVNSKVSAKYTITFPTYDIVFDAVLDGAKIKDASGNVLGTGKYSTSGYYGQTIAVPAFDKSTADGYDFYGFWSKKQPTTGDASYNAATKDFAQPCTEEDYISYGGTAGGTDIITDKDGNKWYNAGKKLDPASAKTLALDEGETNFDNKDEWYGYWLAKEFNVSFYDIDGAFLGKTAVKNGQTQDDIEWPESKYNLSTPYINGAITVYANPGVWVLTDGTVINSNSCTFTQGYDLLLTPQIVKKSDDVFDNSYSIKFINENTGAALSSKNYEYRDTVTVPGDRSVPASIDSTVDYKYEFLGWSTVEPINGKYHVLLEDANFDLEGTAISLNKDWIVRKDATYYPVYRRFLRTYVVNFEYKDSTGKDVERQVSLKYGDKLVAPTDYVPLEYATEGYGYTFVEWNHKDSQNKDKYTFKYSDTPVFTSDNFAITLSAELGATDGTPTKVKAKYSDPVAKPYTVTFISRNDKGEAVTQYAEVRHGKFILQDAIDSLEPATNYDNGEALVTFMGQWKLVNGSALYKENEDAEGVSTKDTYTAEELLKCSPTSHITFEAVYGDPKPYYTVTYIDGSNTFSDRVLAGEGLPAWTTKVDGNDKEYEPSMADDEKGSYVFQGWYDEKQNAADYSTTNGNKYEKGAAVTSNLTLYPQFKFEPFTYTITFMNHDGSVVLGIGEYQYGHNIEALSVRARKAAQTRDKDEKYVYEFIGWDLPVPTYCEGKDMTFTALYRKSYRYYDVKWYNSVAIFDEEGKVEDWKAGTELLATTKHTFNSKLYTPSVDNIVCGVAAPDGQNYVFAGWAYKDAEGKTQKYTRGMAVTGEMEFFATFTLTDKTYTVTTVIDGETEEYKVADGETATIPDPQDGYVDAEKHSDFKGWYTDAAYINEFDFDTKITADITLYAKFEESAHDRSNTETVTAPTYDIEGTTIKWCSCNKEATTVPGDNIACLSDTVAPTGTIYLGTLGFWSSLPDAIPGYATDNDPISLYATPDTTILITANDTAEKGEYNPNGNGIGIDNIKVFVFPAKYVLTAENYGAAQELAEVIYQAEDDEVISNANFITTLGELEVADLDKDGNVQNEDGSIKKTKLKDGETYIIYYTVTDKAGNQLNRKVRTAKFGYDSEAPAIKITGKSDADNEPKFVTYCESAVISNVEVGATLKINDIETNLTATAANGTGSYTIKGAGNYFIEVTDSVGNTASKRIIIADHLMRTTEADATCTVDGYKKEVCARCNYEAEAIVYPATGHTVTSTITPATCTVDGSETFVCADCDFTFTTENKTEWITEIGDAEAIVTKGAGDDIEYLVYVVEDGAKVLVAPCAGHSFDVDENDQPIYTVIKAATCKAAGIKVLKCKVCNETIGEKIEIPADEDAHVFSGKIMYMAPACELEGYTYRTCKEDNCGAIEKILKFDKKEHIEEWVVVKEATCGTNGTMKAICSLCATDLKEATEFGFVDVADGDYTYVKDADGNIVTETVDDKTTYKIYRLPKTNRHDYEDPVITKEPTVEELGIITYSCNDCGFTKDLTVPKLTKYTVKFVDESGATLYEFKDVLVGDTVKLGENQPEPTKANSTDGKYSYTFAGWADASGKIVELPVEVTADMTLKATFTQKKILYTHIFSVPTDFDEETGKVLYTSTTNVTTLVGTLGDIRKTSIEPVFALEDAKADAELKQKYTFEFDGWIRNETNATKEENFDVKSDAEFVAMYKVVPVKYQVIFYSENNFVWNAEVAGGQPVVFEGENPTKNYDNEAHYKFNGWYTDAACTDLYEGEAITASTRLYAGYTKYEHEYTVVEVKAATCTLPEKTTSKCTTCGHTIVEVTDEAEGHKYTESVVDGVPTYTCSICGDSYKGDVAKYNVKFVNDDGSTIQNSTVVHGQKVDYTEGTPEKASTAKFTFTFDHWEDADKNVYSTAQILALEITDNYTFTAVYTDNIRSYRVTYVDFNNNKLHTDMYEYGTAIPEYTGATPTRAYDNTYHYVFAGWSKTTAETVTGNTVISPLFTGIKHDYESSDPIVVAATCETPGKTIKKCTCGDEEVLATSQKALGHTDELDGVKAEHVIVQPTLEKEGSDTYNCVRCGEPQSKTLNKLASQTIVITVYDKNGELAANGVAIVTLINKATNEVGGTTNTNDKGQAIFNVPAGQEWTVTVVNAEGCDAIPKGGYIGDVNADGSFTAGEAKDTSTPECSCSCHKTSFWGILFRLFQKIIRIFNKNAKCCDDPRID
jgi:hypothetical protein